MSIAARASAGLFLGTLLLSGGDSPSAAQQVPDRNAGNVCDISGEWSAQFREDWEERQLLGAHLGDYTGIPLNDAGRQFAQTWNASILSLPTQQTLPHSAHWSMRGPGPNIRIAKFTSPIDGEALGYTIAGVWGRADRTIWTDGRPHPSASAEHTWAGFSTGTCARGIFTVTTTHMKFGYHRRNGIPASIKATMTEHFIRREGVNLMHVQIVEDPTYLDEPLIRTQDFVLDVTQNVGGQGYGYEVADEILSWPKGHVPSFPLGTRHTELSDLLGIPFEATQGHREAMYPEYLATLRALMRSGPPPRAAPGPAPSSFPATPAGAAPDRTARAGIEVVPVKGKVYMLVVGGVNIAAHVGDQGVLLVDTGPASMAGAVLSIVRERFGAPVRYIINTHPHADHSGGNAAIAGASGGRLVGGAPATPAGRAGSPNLNGVIITSHGNTLDRMNGLKPPDPARPDDALPTSTFTGERRKLHFNGEPIEILHQPNAHTDGDVIVFFRASDVIVTGDVYTPDRFPIVDAGRGGSTQGVLDALTRILDITIPEINQRGGTRVIPGHGRLGNEADVDDYRNWMTIIRDRILAMAQKGMALEEVLAAHPTLDFDGVFDDPASPPPAFIESVYRDVRASLQAAAP
jgi:glyoxylase-like metal-dependent hydrolase (beta-lactamase superfamily II)